MFGKNILNTQYINIKSTTCINYILKDHADLRSSLHKPYIQMQLHTVMTQPDVAQEIYKTCNKTIFLNQTLLVITE